jgi:hypothetical protein
MSLLIRLIGGAPPAEPDLIETVAVFDGLDDFELFDLSFADALIGDDALFETAVAAEPVLDQEDEPSGLQPGLFEDDAPILLVATEPEEEPEEFPESVSIADIFLPEGGEEIIVCATEPEADEPEIPDSFTIGDLIEPAFVADPGEVLETQASDVYIPPDDDPNDEGFFVSSNSPFDDEPVVPSLIEFTFPFIANIGTLMNR